MPAEVYSLHGTGNKSLASTKPEKKKRALKYDKSLKRPVDSNAPKKPLTAYFQWASENRKDLKGSSGNVTEITKKLGEMWRKLPKEEKTTFEVKSKKQMSIYKTLMAAYKHTSEHKEFEKSLLEFEIAKTYKPFRKDENMPKKAMSAYMLFQKEKRASIVKKNPDAKVTEIMGLVGAAWKEVSEAKRVPYQKKAKKAAEQHAKDVEEYKNCEKHQRYLKEKKAYELKMKTKRAKLNLKPNETSAGSGISPKAKRRKTDKPAPKKKTESKVPASKLAAKSKKKSQPKKNQLKKKSSAPKNKKKSSAPKKKSSAPKNKKKSSAPMKAKKSSKRKVSEKKKASKKRMARKAQQKKK